MMLSCVKKKQIIIFQSYSESVLEQLFVVLKPVEVSSKNSRSILAHKLLLGTVKVRVLSNLGPKILRPNLKIT